MNIIKIFISILTVAFLVGCATPVERSTYTASGSPEVTIDASIDEVRNEVLSMVLNYGYSLINQTNNLLEFQRQAEGQENFAAALSVGNSYSSNYRKLNVNLIEMNGSVRVIIRSSLEARMIGGQVNTSNAMSNSLFNAYQEDLENLKLFIEREPFEYVPEDSVISD